MIQDLCESALVKVRVDDSRVHMTKWYVVDVDMQGSK